MKRTRSSQIYVPKHTNVSQFVNSTSDFRKIDVNTLNIEYLDAESSNDISPQIENVLVHEDVYVGNLDTSRILEIVKDLDSANDIDRKTKTFVQLVSDIAQNEFAIINTEESRTDSLVCHLFERLEFNEYPLIIRHQPLFKFMIHTKQISSKYDFAIIKGKHIMLVDEDKHIKNTGPPSAWGEYQIAGELIAGAYCNYSSKKTYKEKLYAVRVIGLRFTFYKAIIPYEYLDSLGEGIPSMHIYITRYPPNDGIGDFPSLNYGKADDRREIISMLVRIRESLKN